MTRCKNMTYTYTLKRSKRKTISLTVKPDCTLEVRAPLTTSKRRIDEFVSANSIWIEKNIIKAQELAKAKQNFSLDYSSNVYFFGNRLPIEKAAIRKAKLENNRILMPPDLDSDSIRQQLVSLYKDTARKYISAQLPIFSQKLGVNPSKLMITSAKTNWGSCTSDRVHFSWHLIMAEKEVIDYVIIHELTHIIHHNHSPYFWAEVAKHCPDYKALRARLKHYSDVLNKENW